MLDQSSFNFPASPVGRPCRVATTDLHLAVALITSPETTMAGDDSLHGDLQNSREERKTARPRLLVPPLFEPKELAKGYHSFTLE